MEEESSSFVGENAGDCGLRELGGDGNYTLEVESCNNLKVRHSIVKILPESSFVLVVLSSKFGL